VQEESYWSEAFLLVLHTNKVSILLTSWYKRDLIGAKLPYSLYAPTRY